MIGSANGKGKGKGNGNGNFPSSSGSRGNLHHCKCCGNPQARHTTEKCFEDPRNRDSRASWERRNKKKWIDFKKRKTLKNNKKGNTEHHRGGDSDDDQPSSFAGIAASSLSTNSYILLVSLQSSFVSSTDSLRWIVDTGADRHICKDIELFDSLLHQDLLPMIGTANGPTRPLGSGTVTLNCKLSSGKTRKVYLTDVLYLPSCPLNLFSGRKLYDQGGYIGNQGSVFDSNNLEIASVDSNLLINEEPRQFAFPAALHQARPTLTLWHRRLGHLGLKNVKITEKITQGIKYDVDIKTDPNSDDKFVLCEPCELSRPLSHVRKNITPRNLSPFDQVSVDMVMIKPGGRILSDESWSKINYATIFTESATRYRWGIFHKEKRGAFESVQQFEALSRTQYNCTIKRWRLDGGKEYSPKQMGIMAKSLGQIVELTTPYNPEQDGQSERSIGILGTRTRAVILDQKIPQFLWPEIMRTQIYIVNRIATSVLRNETPFQALNRLTLGNDEIPDLSHLRVLGCKVYVQIPIERRVLSRKLDARAEIGILVGYEGSHIFRVYVPSRKNGIRSSNIRFDEDGYITSAPNELPSDLGEPEFSENRRESENEEIFEKSDETPCLESPSPFEELAHGYGNLDEENIIEENLTEEVSRPSRSKKIYERSSRVTRSGNSIIATPQSPDETIAFASFLAATSSTRDPKSVSEALNGPDSSDWRRAFKKEYDSLRKIKLVLI
ncbi:hypothetical protein K3495_g12220 [Podosphaera aphanis]|nr:hypothetical protein K3495_g12220 [Podosphaera aphanis]